MSAFKRLDLNLAGGTAKNRSSQFSSADTQNYYIEATENGTLLQPFPGAKLFHIDLSTSNADRGMHCFKDELYKVSGASLFKVSNTGSAVNLGFIGGGDPVIMADDGVDMFIATGGTLYKYDGVSLSIVTDTDFESPSAVTYLNGQFIYDGDGSRFGVSEVGDGSNLESFNYASAEATPGELLRPYVFEDFLYLMTTDNTERWYNSGEGKPPFDRLDGGSIKIGLGATHSVCNSDNFIYLLADDLKVYRLKNSQEQSISTPEIVTEITKLSITSDAKGFCFSIENQDFYLLSFPAGDKSFLYSETNNVWTTLSFGIGGGRHLANSFARCYGKNLIADYRNGSVHELDLDTYTDANQTINRVRVLPTISSERFKQPGQRLLMNKFELMMERGVGNSDKEDPKIMVEFSADGGKTFQAMQIINVGRAGQFQQKIEYYLTQSFYEGVFRITTSDPNFFSLRAAALWVKPYGY